MTPSPMPFSFYPMNEADAEALENWRCELLVDNARYALADTMADSAAASYVAKETFDASLFATFHTLRALHVALSMNARAMANRKINARASVSR